MIFTSLLILIVAIAIPLTKQNISYILFSRILTIVFIYTGALTLNALYIQSIGSGIGIYSGLFHVTSITQLLEIFILLTASLILIPSSTYSYTERSPLPKPYLAYASLPSGGEEEGRLQGSGQGNLKRVKEYSIVVLFSTLGSILLLSCSDLISMYLSIELQSFGLYILSSLYRESTSATSAGLKYFLLGGLSSCIILLGSGLIYSYTGLTNFESLYSIVSTISSLPSVLEQGYSGITLGIVLITIGFLFKIAAAPLHNWAPDVYDEVPTIVTIWITIIPKISILVFLLEIKSNISLSPSLAEFNIGISNELPLGLDSLTSVMAPAYTAQLLTPESMVGINGGFATVGVILKNLLLISSLLSLLVGTVLGLTQIKIKRLLAYSTISHIGFILLALAINSESSIESLIFYIIQYTITNLNTFLIVIALSYIILTPGTPSPWPIVNHLLNRQPLPLQGLRSPVTKTGQKGGSSAWTQRPMPRLVSARQGSVEAQDSVKDIRFLYELKGLFFSNPLLSLSLSICLFSMAGIPPLIGFFSKQFVLYSAIESGYYFISVVAIIVSVISASYYLHIIRLLHTATQDDHLTVTVSTESLAYATPGLASDKSTFALSLPSALPFPIQDWQSEAREQATCANLAVGKAMEARVNNSENVAWASPVQDGVAREARGTQVSSSHSYIISILTLFILLFILKPSIILSSTQLLSLNLYYF